MDSRYTNREKYLNKLKDSDLAIMIANTNFNGYDCIDFCPLKEDDCASEYCELRLAKWLGEYSDD